MATDSLSSITQSSKVSNVNFYLDDFEMAQDTIKEVSIIWDGISTFGSITLNDIYDVVNQTKLIPGVKMIVSYTDAHGDFFLRQFEIISSYEKKEQGSKFVQLRFRDVVSTEFERTYISKSYKETTLTEVLNDYFELKVDSLLSGFPVKKYFEQTTNKLKNFVVPKHINFLEFIEAEIAKEGYYFYQFRDGIYLEKARKFVRHEYPYKQAAPHEGYGFNIISYRCTFNNTSELMKTPKTVYKVFDKTKKQMIVYDKGYEDYKNKWKLGGNLLDLVLTNEERHKTKERLIDNTELLNIKYQDNTILEIVVPGNVKYSELWNTISVEMMGNKFSKTTMDSGDIKLSGDYKIFKVEDKILFGRNFVQRLSLKRIDEGKE